LVKAGALIELAPRDTLMHYTVWNPIGKRLRVYTDNDQEPELIASIQIALPAIRNATRLLFDMRTQPLADVNGLKNADRIAVSLKNFLSGLHALRQVEPEVFIRHFRPYYESIRIGATEYRGPGAVTMPLHVFDYLLWGSSEADARYQQFMADYLPYNLPEFRMYILQAHNAPSFLDRVESELSTIERSVFFPSLLCAIGLWMKRVRGFRNAHRKYANRAYHGRESHSFPTGSGGHTTSDLQWLSELTDKHAMRLENIRERARGFETSAPKIAA
jgi:monodechloroaminopyrrolnitrin synthase